MLLLQRLDSRRAHACAELNQLSLVNRYFDLLHPSSLSLVQAHARAFSTLSLSGTAIGRCQGARSRLSVVIHCKAEAKPQTCGEAELQGIFLDQEKVT